MTQDQRGSVVAPLTTENIKRIVEAFKKKLGCDHDAKIDAVHLIDVLQYAEIMEFEVVDDVLMKGEGYEAIAYPDESRLSISQSIYDSAFDQSLRSICTIFHEIGHLILHKDMKMYAKMNDPRLSKYQDPELQADLFAIFMMTGYEDIRNELDGHQLSKKLNVSKQAAFAGINSLKSGKEL
jgi:hypothetical protein